MLAGHRGWKRRKDSHLSLADVIRDLIEGGPILNLSWNAGSSSNSLRHFLLLHFLLLMNRYREEGIFVLQRHSLLHFDGSSTILSFRLSKRFPEQLFETLLVSKSTIAGHLNVTGLVKKLETWIPPALNNRQTNHCEVCAALLWREQKQTLPVLFSRPLAYRLPF
ncbi:unnamed protein product [Nezara viridula]|uniref:Uncharacterized protein n=1 Tax=Nezara viridula TaxID=85310 RepID=A0A9P0MN54_NEZVI|nr:unnamed protein product [Nezara viridula]